MPVTPVWSIPWSTTADPPHGPNQEAAIAAAVESGLNTVDAKAVKAQDRIFEGRLPALSAIGGEADVPSCSTTFTTASANTKVMISAHLRVSSVPNTHYIQGKINVDGSNIARDFFADQHGSLGPGNSSITFPWTLPAAGSHTIKLRAVSSNGGNAEPDSTGITVTVLGS